MSKYLPPAGPHYVPDPDLSPETLLVQPVAIGEHRSLCTPIVQSTTYVRAEIGGADGYSYSRVSNPTVDALESRLGQLEDSPPAVCCSTGLAAETVLFLSLLKSGDHIVCARGVYGGTTRLLQQLLAGLGVRCTFVDAGDEAEVAAAIGAQTRLVFLETPANPTLQLTDLAAICAIARKVGVLTAVDNTFQTPLGQRPLELGADISVYSTTKLIDGHSAALGGALVTRDPELLERFRFVRKSIGCIQTPFNAWQTLQGLKTLAIRLREQSRNALTVARWLEGHDLVARVNYPGLDSSPRRKLAQRQHCLGDGNVLSLELRGGFEPAVTLAGNLRLCRLAEHVGSVETLITHSASMTHADVPAADRRRAGIPDGLLRLSVGLENPGEIIGDLTQALEVVRVSLDPRPAAAAKPVCRKEWEPCPVL